MKNWLVAIAILALLVAHQDYGQWSRTELVWGFMPYNMAYHIGVSMATAVVWILVCLFCWPKELETQAAADPSSDGGTR